jgi:hypothetical protein
VTLGNTLKDEQAVQIACGFYHSVLLTNHGRVFTSGSGAQGELGHGNDKPLRYFSPIKYVIERVGWFIGSLVHWFIGSLVHWFIGSLVHWFIDSLVGWLVGWLVGTEISKRQWKLRVATRIRHCAPKQETSTPGAMATTANSATVRCKTSYHHDWCRHCEASAFARLHRVPSIPLPSQVWCTPTPTSTECIATSADMCNLQICPTSTRGVRAIAIVSGTETSKINHHRNSSRL